MNLQKMQDSKRICVTSTPNVTKKANICDEDLKIQDEKNRGENNLN